MRKSGKNKWILIESYIWKPYIMEVSLAIYCCEQLWESFQTNRSNNEKQTNIIVYILVFCSFMNGRVCYSYIRVKNIHSKYTAIFLSRYLNIGILHYRKFRIITILTSNYR